MTTRIYIAAILSALTIAGSVQGQQISPATQPVTASASQSAPATQPISASTVITQHTLTLSSGPLAYTATAGFMPLKDDAGKTQAQIFYVAYTRPGQDSSTRPVTFCFNGGPGSASVWLHIGALGPRRVLFNDDGTLPPPPYRLADNPETWLTFTDLVFIDPVNTGYSRPANPGEGGKYHDVNGDAKSVAEFIRLYLTDSQRWQSPRFLAGESYGTTRAALLADILNRNGIALNGISLISTVLNFQTLSPSDSNEIPYPLFLPTYTTTAYLHHKLPADLQNKPLADVQKEVEHFALTAYLPALAQGTSLADKDRNTIALSLARYTGLSVDYITKSALRIPPHRFEQALLNDSGLIVGRMDSRLTGHSPDPANDSAQYDPALDAYRLPYTGLFNAYVRSELRFESSQPYEVLSDRVYPWNFNTSGGIGAQGYLYVGDNLRDAMLVNPQLRVFVASGLYDLATPYMATQYTINHLGLPQSLLGNIEHHHYAGGHMMYHVHSELRKLSADVADFYARTLKK